MTRRQLKCWARERVCVYAYVSVYQYKSGQPYEEKNKDKGEFFMFSSLYELQTM